MSDQEKQQMIGALFLERKRLSEEVQMLDLKITECARTAKELHDTLVTATNTTDNALARGAKLPSPESIATLAERLPSKGIWEWVSELYAKRQRLTEIGARLDQIS